MKRCVILFLLSLMIFWLITMPLTVAAELSLKQVIEDARRHGLWDEYVATEESTGDSSSATARGGGGYAGRRLISVERVSTGHSDRQERPSYSRAKALILTRIYM